MFNCDGATLLLRIGVTNFQCLQLHHFVRMPSTTWLCAMGALSIHHTLSQRSVHPFGFPQTERDGEPASTSPPTTSHLEAPAKNSFIASFWACWMTRSKTTSRSKVLQLLLELSSHLHFDFHVSIPFFTWNLPTCTTCILASRGNKTFTSYHGDWSLTLKL